LRFCVGNVPVEVEPAEINERYRKQRQKQWAAHSEFLGDLDHLVNEPADAEWLAAEELAETVPTTLPGLLAMLVYLGELDDPSAFMEDNGQTLFETLASGAKALVGRPA
jgi:hypothetical protein